KGYQLDDQGIPTFITQIDELVLEDRMEALPNYPGLNRQLSWTGSSTVDVRWRLAAGQEIEKTDRGSYLIDGAYYIQLDERSSGKAELIEADGRVHLVASPEGESLEYQIVW
ncbi:MAG: hypothetical protein AAFY91_03215, partial [Bacteroidota bacterium]